MCYFILEVQKENDNIFIASVWSMELVVMKADWRNAPISNPFKVTLQELSYKHEMTIAP